MVEPRPAPARLATWSALAGLVFGALVPALAGCSDDAAQAPTGPPDWCEGAPPDAACFADARAPQSESVTLARAIGDKMLDTRDPTSLRWDWGEAVMMLGLDQLWRVTGDARYRDFYKAYVDHHIAEGYALTTSDSAAPAALAIALVRDGDPDPAYRAVAEAAMTYLAEDALRTPEGGLNHHGVTDILGVSLWADSLFMFGNLMTGWGDVTDDVALLDAYADQFGIFATLMQEEPGFFKHAVYSIFEQTPDIYWARANAWIVAAGYDHLRVRRDRGLAAPGVEASLGLLVDGALAAQDAESGLWWNILNRPGEIYLETSAAALFAFGMARAWRYGYQDARVLPAIEAAMAGVRARITTDEDGRPLITGISGPTSVGDYEFYANIPLGDDLSYGVGAVLLALTETSGL